MSDNEDIRIRKCNHQGGEIKKIVLALSKCPTGYKIRENVSIIGYDLGLQHSDLLSVLQKEGVTEIWHDLISTWTLKSGDNATITLLYSTFLELQLLEFADVLHTHYPDIINRFLKDLNKESSESSLIDETVEKTKLPTSVARIRRDKNVNPSQGRPSTFSYIVRRSPLVWKGIAIAIGILFVIIIIILITSRRESPISNVNNNNAINNISIK